jgi:hypothetical protein
VGIAATQVLLVVRFSCFVLIFQLVGAEAMAEQEEFKITIKGPGLSFDQSVDKGAATKIMSFVMTGSALPEGAGSGAGAGSGSGASGLRSAHTPVRGSLASFIKSKKGEKNQNTRFLATASWLSGRSQDPLTAKAVAKALADHNQRRLANPADCLNQNVRKGFCEKRKDGSFFVTPEGIDTIEGATAE